MKEKQIWFYSDGLKLQGTFYYPDAGQADETKPDIVICSGFMGLNNIHPARFARALTEKGYACFGFDYRGFAQSEGTPGKVLLEEQIRDIENAAIFVSMQKKNPDKKTVLIGWGMGAGLVLEAAYAVPDLAGMISINGFYNGFRFFKAYRSEAEYKKFMAWLLQQRFEEVKTGKSVRVDPFKIYPLDTVTRGYVDEVLFKTDGFGGAVDIGFAYSLLRYNPEGQLEQQVPDVPLLVVHGEDNRLHPLSEAKSLYQKYPGDKTLHIIPRAGHTEWMCDDCKPFQKLIATLLTWLESKVAT
ncbi:MAG: alpha/beta fold hydrolase [Desulfotignum sp.]|nr:alpha/beta fold hydrolase [Desulfotignum sp.]